MRNPVFFECWPVVCPAVERCRGVEKEKRMLQHYQFFFFFSVFFFFHFFLLHLAHPLTLICFSFPQKKFAPSNFVFDNKYGKITGSNDGEEATAADGDGDEAAAPAPNEEGQLSAGDGGAAAAARPKADLTSDPYKTIFVGNLPKNAVYVLFVFLYVCFFSLLFRVFSNSP
jgi:hypothetical protein